MDEQDTKSYSIQTTVQRTKIEYGFVSVLVTSDLMDEENHLDTDKLFASAARIADHPEMLWYPETEQIEIAPVQKVRKDEALLAVDTTGRKV